MRRLLVAAVAMVVLGGCDTLTDHPRCDEAVAGPVIDILSAGYGVDCSPGFSSIDPATGILHHGWFDPARATVWVWAEQVDDRMLLKVLWHEAGHARGADTEWEADAYAYCHMTPAQRLGIGFLAPWPTTC